jgi:predicted phosphodiesterase
MRAGGDLLRFAPIRARLLSRLEGIDQLVLLGDVFELRQLSIDQVLETSKSLFEEIGKALGKNGRLVLVPGNHDHRIARPLLTKAGEDLADTLSVSARPVAFDDKDPLAPLQAALGPTELVVAYPGYWIRPDVYATHGHYLDAHTAIPTFETVAVSLSTRVSRSQLSEANLAAADYEGILGAVYSMIERTGQATAPIQHVTGSHYSAKILEQLARDGSPAVFAGRQLLEAAVASVNRLGLGPFESKLSSRQLRIAGTSAMAQVIRGLGINADYVLFGHTHLAGPRPGQKNFSLPGGTKLVNTGNWVYDGTVLAREGLLSPYWPGVCTVVGASGRPRQFRLLDDIDHLTLRQLLITGSLDTLVPS